MDANDMTTTTTDPTSPSEPTQDDRLVRIVSLEGDEFDAVADRSIEALVSHLAQWDYGDENDGAATVNGYTTVSDAERFGAEAIEHGGLVYWCSPDDGLRSCTLWRRPLSALLDEDDGV